MPVVAVAAAFEGCFFELPDGFEAEVHAGVVFELGVAEHAAGDGASSGAGFFDVGGFDDRDRDAGDAFAEHDVLGVGGDDGLFVVVVGAAFGGGDEAGAELAAGVSHLDGLGKSGGVADAAGADEGDVEVGELGEEGGGVGLAGVAAGSVVDADEAVDAVGEGEVGPFAVGDVVVDDASHGMDGVDDPAGVAEGGDKEADAFFEGDVDPAAHSVFVDFAAFFDDGIEADGFVGEGSDLADAFAEVAAVHVDEGDGLDDADASGGGDGGDEFDV